MWVWSLEETLEMLCEGRASCNLLSDTWSSIWCVTGTQYLIHGLINDKLVRFCIQVIILAMGTDESVRRKGIGWSEEVGQAEPYLPTLLDH